MSALFGVACGARWYAEEAEEEPVYPEGESVIYFAPQKSTDNRFLKLDVVSQTLSFLDLGLSVSAPTTAYFTGKLVADSIYFPPSSPQPGVLKLDKTLETIVEIPVPSSSSYNDLELDNSGTLYVVPNYTYPERIFAINTSDDSYSNTLVYSAFGVSARTIVKAPDGDMLIGFKNNLYRRLSLSGTPSVANLAFGGPGPGVLDPVSSKFYGIHYSTSVYSGGVNLNTWSAFTPASSVSYGSGAPAVYYPPNGKIYAVGGNRHASARIFDPSDESVVTTDFGLILYNSNWTFGVIGSDGKIYFCPSTGRDYFGSDLAAQFLVIDPSDDSAVLTDFGLDLSSGTWVGYKK